MTSTGQTSPPDFVVPGAADFIEFPKEAFGAQERERFGPA